MCRRRPSSKVVPLCGAVIVGANWLIAFRIVISSD
jgi:hypothetical protein